MKKIALLVAVLLAAVCAYADPIPSLNSTNPISVTLISFPGGLWQNGYPYTLGMTGVTNPIDAMCDDYLHGGVPGESWTANITNLGNDGIGLARFNLLPDALTLYKEAGWILLQTPITPPNEFTDMNFAVWHIFDPAVLLGQGAQGWLDAAEAEAARGFPGVPFDDVFIITPVTSTTPTPKIRRSF